MRTAPSATTGNWHELDLEQQRLECEPERVDDSSAQHLECILRSIAPPMTREAVGHSEAPVPRAVRRRQQPPPKWRDEGAASALESGNTALDKVVGRNAGKTADVTVRRVGDDVLVDVRGVPLSKARAALSAIAKALK